MSNHTLRVDWPNCKAHGLCAEILPEIVSLDQWGYPIVKGPVTGDVLTMARSAVKACPTLALRLTKAPPRHGRIKDRAGWLTDLLHHLGMSRP